MKARSQKQTPGDLSEEGNGRPVCWNPDEVRGIRSACAARASCARCWSHDQLACAWCGPKERWFPRGSDGAGLRRPDPLEAAAHAGFLAFQNTASREYGVDDRENSVLAHRAFRIRQSAWQTLGLLDRKQTLAHQRSTPGDQRASVRQEVARVLGELRDARAFDLLG